MLYLRPFNNPTAVAIARAALPDVTAVVDAINDLSTDDDLAKRSDDSAAMLEYWDLTDDIVTGAKAIKDGGEKYFPKFPDENDKDYKYRLENTKFTNIYRDIVEALAAKPFEEEVSLVKGQEITIPKEIEEFVENVDGSGANLTVYAAHTFFAGINSAIDWIFVDYPKAEPGRVRTLAQAKIDGIRPFWSHVLGRNILDAKSVVINGEETLIYIKILEPGNPNHIRIFERMSDGLIVWSLWREFLDTKNNKKTYIKDQEGQLTIDQIPLVPFMTGRRNGRSFKLYPVMRDAADLQIELYNQESDLKFTKKLTAYPMLSGNGVNPPMEADGRTPKKIATGPARVLYAPRNGEGQAGSWSFVEPSATSLDFLSKDIDKTKQDLRELGRQPLTAQSGNLTVITTQVAAGKSKSAVGAWALNLKNALENALVITCKWLDIKKETYDPQVRVYDEFDEFDTEGKDLDALAKMREGRDISQETLWDEMKRRRVLSPEFDKEEELKRLLNEVPSDGELPGDDDPEPPNPNDDPNQPKLPGVE